MPLQNLKTVVSGHLMSLLPINWLLQKSITIRDQKLADFRPFENMSSLHKLNTRRKIGAA